jgi:hypothetical protein
MSRLFFVLILPMTGHTLMAKVENLYRTQAEILRQDEHARQQAISNLLRIAKGLTTGDWRGLIQ